MAAPKFAPVPAVDDAVYADAACVMLVGRARTIAEPSLFLAYASIAGDPRPARLLRAGAAIDPIAQFYELRDGACIGPLLSPGDPIAYFETGDEIDGAGVVPIREVEVGDGRLAVQVRESDDGARVPFGLRDRVLGARLLGGGHEGRSARPGRSRAGSVDTSLAGFARSVDTGLAGFGGGRRRRGARIAMPAALR